MARIDDMLRHMKEQDGSDLHLVAGISPRIRSHGELVEVEGWPELTDESVQPSTSTSSPWLRIRGEIPAAR